MTTRVSSASSPTEGFLDSVPFSSATLVIEGPSGIGKSHAWTRAVQSAKARGWLVLESQPSQAETRLVGSALIDLMERVSDAQLQCLLPTPQCQALRAALLREAGGVPDADPRSAAVSLSTLLRGLAATQPVLVAVDNAQWLDAGTDTALAFVARRLPDAGLGILLAWRGYSAGPVPAVIDAIGASATRYRVPPLEPGAIERLVIDQLPFPVPGPALHRAVQVSGGNPLYALEAARALVRAGSKASYESVRLPSMLRDVVEAHLMTLPADSRMALAAAASLSRPTLGQLRELELDDALVAAERVGLVHVAGDEVGFAHPLFAAVAYDDLPGSERARLHSRLAEVVDGPEERARHLALGVNRQSAAVAATLDEARDRAHRRGALYAAADAARLSIRATPAGDPAIHDRRRALGHLLFRSGETDAAREVLTAVAESDAEDRTRAKALCELARIATDTEPGPRATELAYEGLALAGHDHLLAADLHVILTLARYDDIQAALHHAQRAAVLLDRAGSRDPGRNAAALAALAETSFRAGRGLDHAACQRAIELEGKTVPPAVSNRAIVGYAFMLMYADELDLARDLFQQAHQMAIDEGDHASLPEAVGHLSLIELWSGNWDAAEQYALDGLVYSERTGQEWSILTSQSDLGWVHAHRGRLEESRVIGRQLVVVGEEADDVASEIWGRSLLGFCAMARGDAALAVQELSRHAELRAGTNSREPGFYWIAPYYVEALAAVDRLDEAAEVLDAYEREATTAGRRSAIAAATRCRALIAAARGEFVAATSAAEDAVRLYDHLERPFDRANALLAKGQVHRRLKQKALAKESLTQALQEFERLGAPDFAERARGELSRIGLRPRAPRSLTETEQQIAIMTAQGLTTKEVAAALFLSPRTVAGNLTRIYRKLGIRNRSELSVRLQSLPLERTDVR